MTRQCFINSKAGRGKQLASLFRHPSFICPKASFNRFQTIISCLERGSYLVVISLYLYSGRNLWIVDFDSFDNPLSQSCAGMFLLFDQ